MVLFALAFANACGDDDVSAPLQNTSDAGHAACPALGGAWTIAAHCGANLIGMSVPVTQDRCTISTSGVFAGLSGEVASDGSFTLAGTVSGMSVSCTGTASATEIRETCTGACMVTLTR